MPPLDNDHALKELGKIEGVLEQHLGTGVFASDEVRPAPRVTTGIKVVDYILGGGLVKGQICEVFGPEATGKTTFFAQVAAANQKLDPNWRVLYLDFEQTLDPSYLKNGLGMDTTKPRFILSQPKTIEEGVLLSKILMSRDLVNQVIWDTPAASQPAELLNSGFDDKAVSAAYRELGRGESERGRIAGHASVFSHGISSLVGLIAEKGVVYCIPNQIRTTINTWGAGETTSGGRALKFYASTRIRLSKKETRKESVIDPFFGSKSQTAVENKIQFHCVKNKTAPPFRLADVRLAYGRGFLDKETLLDLAIKRKIIKKGGGGNFELPGGKKLRGTDELVAHYTKQEPEYDKLCMALYDTDPGGDEYEADLEELPEGRVPI